MNGIPWMLEESAIRGKDLDEDFEEEGTVLKETWRREKWNDRQWRMNSY